MARVRLLAWAIAGAWSIFPLTVLSQTPPASGHHHTRHPQTAASGPAMYVGYPPTQGGGAPGAPGSGSPVFAPSLAGSNPMGAAPGATLGPDGFLGNWAFASNVTVAISSPISTTESRSTREAGEVISLSPSEDRFTFISENGERCVLNGARMGATAVTFAAGQQCGVTDSVRNMHLNLTLRSGTASLTGDIVALQFEWNVEAQAFLPISGIAAQRTTGSRSPATGQAAAPAPNTAPAIAAPAPAPSPAVPTGGPAVYGMQPVAPGGYPTAAPMPGAYAWPTATPYGYNTSPQGMYGTPQPTSAPGVYTYPSMPPYATRAPVYAPSATPNPSGYPTAYPSVQTAPRGYPYVYPPPDPNSAQPLYLPGYGGPMQMR